MKQTRDTSVYLKPIFSGARWLRRRSMLALIAVLAATILFTPTFGSSETLTEAEALEVASAHIAWLTSNGLKPEWNGVKAGNVTPFYSSNLRLRAYEVEVHANDGTPSGGILVNPETGSGAIFASHTQGRSLSRILLDYAQEVGIPLGTTPRDYVFLLSTPACQFALGLRNIPLVSLPSVAKGFYEDGLLIVAPEPDFRKPIYHWPRE
ncbi:MAG: hypothetical protein HY900_03635 [Deltaproteobacteria bacterium]|nr:hypothetical protein [Deltaproteobacteria bacterium]